MGIDRSIIVIYAFGMAASMATLAFAFWLFITRGKSFSPKVFQVIAGASMIFLLLGQLMKFYGNRNYLDFAVWLQIVFNVAAGDGPVSQLQGNTISGHAHWFSNHFTPLVYLIGWAYKIAPWPESLVFLQWLLLCATLHAAYLCGKQMIGSTYAGWAVACLLSLYPTFQYIGLYEFEMLRFALPALFYAFYFSLRRNWRCYWLLVGVALLVREEVAITMCCFGIYLSIYEPQARRHGFMTIVASLCYFLLVLKIIMPHFEEGHRSEHIATSLFAALGSTPTEVLKTVVFNPAVLARLILDPVKLANLLMYLLPLGFLPLLGWPLLIATLGNIGLNVLSQSNTHTSFFLYYLAPSIPFLVLAACKGLQRVEQYLSASVRFHGKPIQHCLLSALVAEAFVCHMFFGPSPLSLTFWWQDYRLAPFRTQRFYHTQYVPLTREIQFATFIARVPRSASVSTEQHLVRHFIDRHNVRVFPDLSEADYVVIDKLRPEKTGIGTVAGSWDGLRQNPQLYYDLVEHDPAWLLDAEFEGYYIFRRKFLGGTER